MTQRTCNIIRACKGSIYSEIADPIDRVKAYMSDECDYPAEQYTTGDIQGILTDAVYDYIDTCDRPSYFLRLMIETRAYENKVPTRIQRICRAFILVQVKNDTGYINGFKEEFFK